MTQSSCSHLRHAHCTHSTPPPSSMSSSYDWLHTQHTSLRTMGSNCGAAGCLARKLVDLDDDSPPLCSLLLARLLASASLLSWAFLLLVSALLAFSASFSAAFRIFSCSLFAFSSAFFCFSSSFCFIFSSLIFFRFSFSFSCFFFFSSFSWIRAKH